MHLPPEPHGTMRATAAPSSPRPARRRLWACVALLLLAGCGDDGTKQRVAYDEAVAAIAREKSTLENIKAEQQRVYGEWLLYDFEGRVWAGSFSFSDVVGLPWTEHDYTRDPPLYAYLRNKLPISWFGQLDRLLIEKPEALPWYSRTEGGLYRRRTQDRYSRALGILHDRVELQEDRVRKAEEYARLIAPERNAN